MCCRIAKEMSTVDGKKCSTENEPAWWNNFSSLFCTVDPVPKGGLGSGTRFNAVTRLVIYITFFLIISGFKDWHIFFIAATIVLFVLYSKHIRKDLTVPASAATAATTASSSATSARRENFAFLSETNLKDMSATSSLPPVVYDNTSNGLRMLYPQYEIPQAYQAEQIRSDDPKNQLRLNAIDTKNSTNSYMYYEDRATNLSGEFGHRDPQAGIQYFTPHVGVNRRTMIEPVIAPRITDQDYWGRASTVVDGVNSLYTIDVTNEHINITDMAQVPERHPYAQGYKVSYPLGIPVKYENRVPGGVWNMNPVGQDPDIGFYESSQNLYNSSSLQDFDRNYLPKYDNSKSYVVPVLDMQPTLTTPTQPTYRPWDAVNTTPLPPTNYIGFSNQQLEEQQGSACSSCSGGGSKKETKEGFHFVDTATTPIQPAPQVPQTTTLLPPPEFAYPQQMNNYITQPAQYPLTTQYVFNTPGDKTMLGAGYSEMNRVPPGQNAQIPAVTNQLMYQSPTYSYNGNYFDTPNRKLFLQTVQPSLFSYNVNQTPINSNIGISYVPQLNPRVLNQIDNAGTKFPLYSRIDPQLVRTDGTPGQQATQPIRTDWSAEYSNFQAPAGSVNFEDIYDPRFTSYGDPYRSYTDINLGQVQYYYSDIDAYKMPNFITRSNVDFVDYRTPQGQIWPEYKRNASLDDVRPHVENQTTADELYHREDLMSLKMDKKNREMWQLRFAPLNTNNSFR